VSCANAVAVANNTNTTSVGFHSACRKRHAAILSSFTPRVLCSALLLQHRSNKVKNVLHSFFLAKTAIREPTAGCHYVCITFECDFVDRCSPSRERIRQIEANTLRKLRQPSRSGKLRLFLDNVHE
jgi:hypothetical protein